MCGFALLASLSLPAIGSVMRGRSLNDATSRALGAVSAARQEAISRQANVAVVVTRGRSGDPRKSEAIILLKANASNSGGGAPVWTWQPLSKWVILPTAIEVKPDSGSFLGPAGGTSSVVAYDGIPAALPKLNGDPITDYAYVVFRPDGTIDSASSAPALDFRRLRPDAASTESALVLSPDSGRARIVRL